jgi:chaperonin GroEL (HSP60 family)
VVRWFYSDSGFPLYCHYQFIEEAERSLHDAIMIVRRAMKNSTVVAGGGAIDV